MISLFMSSNINCKHEVKRYGTLYPSHSTQAALFLSLSLSLFISRTRCSTSDCILLLPLVYHLLLEVLMGSLSLFWARLGQPRKKDLLPFLSLSPSLIPFLLLDVQDVRKGKCLTKRSFNVLKDRMTLPTYRSIHTYCAIM